MAGNKKKEKNLKVGVLALQGDVEKHSRMLIRCGVDPVYVRLPSDLKHVNGLIIPGGESTTVGKLLSRYGLDKEIIKYARLGMPIFGTCTGMILLAKEIVGSEQNRLGLMDISVLRNAFGRQVDSFEADLDIKVVGPPTFRAVFIRAPYVVSANNSTEALAHFEDKLVLVKQGNLLACAFHPELTEDLRIHEYFVELVQSWLSQTRPHKISKHL